MKLFKISEMDAFPVDYINKSLPDFIRYLMI